MINDLKLIGKKVIWSGLTAVAGGAALKIILTGIQNPSHLKDIQVKELL